jgi:hypothetical protein
VSVSDYCDEAIMLQRRAPLTILALAGSVGMAFLACSTTPPPIGGSGGGGPGAGGGAGGNLCLASQGCGTGGSGGAPAGGGGIPLIYDGGGPNLDGGGQGGLGGLGGAGSSCACDETWSLECYCAEFECPTFEEAIEDPPCLEPSSFGESMVYTGCGLVWVFRTAGDDALRYTYTEDAHTLTEALSITESYHGSCNSRFYSGGLTGPLDCDDGVEESLCP